MTPKLPRALSASSRGPGADWVGSGPLRVASSEGSFSVEQKASLSGCAKQLSSPLGSLRSQWSPALQFPKKVETWGGTVHEALRSRAAQGCRSTGLCRNTTSSASMSLGDGGCQAASAAHITAKTPARPKSQSLEPEPCNPNRNPAARGPKPQILWPSVAPHHSRRGLRLLLY